MLVDLPKNWRESCGDIDFLRMIRELHAEQDEEIYPIRLARGVYLDHFNFDHEIEHLTWDKDNRRLGYGDSVLRLWTHEIYVPDEQDLAVLEPEIVSRGYEFYGVCDHWTQVLLKFPQLQTSEIRYLVHLSSIKKAHQEPESGWRWHKWGPYIGVFQEQAQHHEYLFDTPDVEEVFVYSVHEMRDF